MATTTKKGSTLEEFLNPGVHGFRPERAHEERPESQKGPTSGKRSHRGQKRPKRVKRRELRRRGEPKRGQTRPEARVGCPEKGP